MDSKSKSLSLILIITMSKIILLFIILDTVYFTVSYLFKSVIRFLVRIINSPQPTPIAWPFDKRIADRLIFQLIHRCYIMLIDSFVVPWLDFYGEFSLVLKVSCKQSPMYRYFTFLPYFGL